VQIILNYHAVNFHLAPINKKIDSLKYKITYGTTWSWSHQLSILLSF